MACDRPWRRGSLRFQADRGRGSMASSLTLQPGSIELLRSPWTSQFSKLLSAARQRLLLASPFITRSVVTWICEQMADSSSTEQIRVLCLTNIRMESVLAGFLELEGLADLGRAFRNLTLVHLPSLHAKVYVADDKCAIVTSGNLTDGGLRTNCEYGIAIHAQLQVREIARHFEGYSRLGAIVAIDEVAGLASEVASLRERYRKTERQVVRQSGGAFAASLRSINDKVLRFRARGKSNQAIFCATIEHILARGPLRTVELHPLIQQIHPDICDDDIDRVIDGVNFGKKWKHHVRTAQQALKREGRISFDGQRWRLTT